MERRNFATVADGLSPMKIWNPKSMNMEFPAPVVLIHSTMIKKEPAGKTQTAQTGRGTKCSSHWVENAG